MVTPVRHTPSHLPPSPQRTLVYYHVTTVALAAEEKVVRLVRRLSTNTARFGHSCWGAKLLWITEENGVCCGNLYTFTEIDEARGTAVRVSGDTVSCLSAFRGLFSRKKVKEGKGIVPAEVSFEKRSTCLSWNDLFCSPYRFGSLRSRDDLLPHINKHRRLAVHKSQQCARRVCWSE